MENITSNTDTPNTNNGFERLYPPMPIPDGQAIWFPFQKHKLLVKSQGQHISLLQGEKTLLANLKHDELLYLGNLNGMPCIASAVDAEEHIPANWQGVGLRELYSLMDGIEYTIATYASQIINWHQTSRYCPVCGSPMASVPGGWGRRCTRGDYSGYPPVIPAMIVLIYDGDRILLSHKPGWGKRYGLIAGFVEPGETLEECVHREVKEEAGIEIDNLHYIKSQPWPFPNQLMVGFTARYKSGTLQPQDNELDDVRWFTRETLPETPPNISLAYMLISDWLNKEQDK
ncbi:NADH pyrophosphatase [Dictyobacter alpinus]|uniref:NAD(+) diphosphatase n=1 Tax=Dictyobacter alpinus TaxID=2014873 RepID=A0A402BIH1_9CHLR|nr:NAD(+) diphosphatase [Dictyobacter alpinus]GCE31032.1 NADH pyrophosphatase [Dictyobacter alpinus]